jgi:hypothetical protein
LSFSVGKRGRKSNTHTCRRGNLSFPLVDRRKSERQRQEIQAFQTIPSTQQMFQESPTNRKIPLFSMADAPWNVPALTVKIP